MSNRLSKFYFQSLGRFFECAKSYRLDLKNFRHDGNFEQVEYFEFNMPGQRQMSLFHKLYEGVQDKIATIEDRFASGNYICFAYLDKTTNRIAYARWLCLKSYYSETLKKNMLFSDDEALTLDSYTHPDYRKLGLHRKMNIQMLHWIKQNTSIRFVYMVIRCFIPHLTKYPRLLGYKPIKRVLYYKNGSIKKFLMHSYKKIMPGA
jgi:hypothetical protein